MSIIDNFKDIKDRMETGPDTVARRLDKLRELGVKPIYDEATGQWTIVSIDEDSEFLKNIEGLYNS